MIVMNRAVALIVLSVLSPLSRGDFTIAVEYSMENPPPAEHQLVIEAAAGMWEALIEDSLGAETLTVTVSFEPLDSAGAQTSPDPTGVPSYAAITINSLVDWFIDPTPWENEEFSVWSDGCLHGFGVPGNQYDLLTACLHEIGHALGYSPDNDVFAAAITGSSDPCDDWFLDDGGFEITLQHDLTPTGCVHMGHTAARVHPCDVMNAPLSTGSRRLITIFPALTGLQYAYGYGIPVTYARSDYAGVESGTAAQPFDTVAEAIAEASSGDTLLIKTGSYDVPEPIVADRALLIKAVLGTVTIGE